MRRAGGQREHHRERVVRALVVKQVGEVGAAAAVGPQLGVEKEVRSLGAEGVGKDVNMIIGNGYTKGHADVTIQILRDSPVIRKAYEKLYA